MIKMENEKCIMCGNEVKKNETCYCFFSTYLPKMVYRCHICKSCFDFLIKNDTSTKKIDERTCTKPFSELELKYSEALLSGGSAKIHEFFLKFGGLGVGLF